MNKILTLLLTLSITGAAAANEATTTTMDASDIEYVQGTNDNPAGWIPFVGAGVSAVDYDKAFNNVLDGTAGNVRVNAAYYARTLPLIFDTGLGFDTADLNTQVDSGLFEIATRYRLFSARKWQVGPVANVNFGDQAGSKYASNTENFATFAGLQFARDFAVGKTGILRAGLKGLTDIGISDTNAQKYLFEVQYGYTSAPTQVTETYTAQPEQKVAEEKIEEVKEEKVEIVQEARATVIERLVTLKNPQALYFDKSIDTVGPKNRAYIEKMVGLLNANKDEVKEVVLTGYADSTGNSAANSKLAYHRAIQIKAELEKAGLDKDIAVNLINGGELSRADVGNDLRRARRVDVEVAATDAVNKDLEAGLQSILRKN